MSHYEEEYFSQDDDDNENNYIENLYEQEYINIEKIEIQYEQIKLYCEYNNLPLLTNRNSFINFIHLCI